MNWRRSCVLVNIGTKRVTRSFKTELYCHRAEDKYHKMNSHFIDELYWNPENIIDTNKPPDENYAIVILNRRISTPPNVVEHLWQNAEVRVTVDGGTNRWVTFLQNSCKGKDMKTPDYITGDFDSVTEDSFKYFDNLTCKRVHTPDQNETDFTKSLRVIKPIIAEKDLKTIVVVHENSGRLDQIMANVNTLFKAKTFLDDIKIYLISSNSLTWLLSPGKHSISIPTYLVEKRRWCALIPVGDKSVVSTTGLKWNLDNHVAQFGGIVSTSNTYASEIVTINCKGYLLWSMGVFSFDDD